MYIGFVFGKSRFNFAQYNKKIDMTEFQISTGYIELIRLLKAVKFAFSGAEAKMLVEEEMVTVNGEIELRKRAKLRRGDVVEVEGKSVKII